MTPTPERLKPYKDGSVTLIRRSSASRIIAVVLLGLSISIAIVFTVVASSRPLTPLEGTLLQGLSLLAGLAGSYIFGTISARDTARDLIKPHARSAFRRVLALYMSLSRLARAIDSSGTQARARNEPDGGFTPFDTLQAIVVEQIATAGDA